MSIFSTSPKIVTNINPDLSSIIRQTKHTNEPIFISKDGEPAAVLLNHTVYEELIKKCNKLEKLYIEQETDLMSALTNDLEPKNTYTLEELGFYDTDN